VIPAGIRLFPVRQIVPTDPRFKSIGINKYKVLISGIESSGFNCDTVYKFKV
jgi:hypothetical protein